jgi:hypothetical protein
MHGYSPRSKTVRPESGGTGFPLSNRIFPWAKNCRPGVPVNCEEICGACEVKEERDSGSPLRTGRRISVIGILGKFRGWGKLFGI